MNIVFNIHNQRNNTATQKVVELVESLSKENPNNLYHIFCTSQNNKFLVEIEDYEKIKIYKFPDIFSGSLRQGLDLFNSLVRIYYLTVKLDYHIMHSVDARPTIFISSIFSKFILKKPLILSWWDYYGNGGILEQKFGKLFSKTIGVFLKKMDFSLRKSADCNLVVSESLFKKINRINSKSTNVLLRVGSTKKHNLYVSNANILPKHDYIFYCGALTKNEKIFLKKVAEYISNLRKDIKIYVSGNDLKESKGLVNFGILKNFDDVLNLIKNSKFVILPFENTNHNKNRWPSKISDYLMMGKAVVSTPINLLTEIDKPFAIFSNEFSFESLARKVIETFDNDNIINEHEIKSNSFYDNELSNEIISKKVIKIYNSLAEKI